jgi:hypothetical protein
MRALAPALALAALLGAGQLHAQQAPRAPACPETDAALPAEFAGWNTTQTVGAATDPGALMDAGLTVGSSAAATLHPMDDVKFAVPPHKASGAASQGGLFSLTINRAGTYAVAVGSSAWIDLVLGGAAVASTAHGHGPACSSIDKVVDFQLKPGRYLVQVSNNDDANLRIMVAKRP